MSTNKPCRLAQLSLKLYVNKDFAKSKNIQKRVFYFVYMTFMLLHSMNNMFAANNESNKSGAVIRMLLGNIFVFKSLPIDASR